MSGEMVMKLGCEVAVPVGGGGGGGSGESKCLGYALASDVMHNPPVFYLLTTIHL